MTEPLSPVPPRHILAAARRLEQSGLVRRTPTEHSRPLSARLGADVHQKLELFQPTGSFKPRGSANKILRLRDEEPDAFRRGFVAASAGNHGLGVSHAAASLGARATLVVPRTVSPAKLEALWRYPVELIVSVGNYDVAESEGRKLAKERGLAFISPYNDPDVIAGAGTVGLEVLEDLPEIDAILVPVGGGGLIAGIALWIKAVAPRVRVIGVQSDAYPAMHAALAAGKLVTVPDKPSLADGLAGNVEAGAITFDLCRRFVDDMVLVSEEEIAEAIRYFAREEQLIVEGSGAVGAAALLAGKIDPGRLGAARPKIVNVVTGRNLAEAKLRDLLGVPAPPPAPAAD